jgi:hypothetical protein
MDRQQVPYSKVQPGRFFYRDGILHIAMYHGHSGFDGMSVQVESTHQVFEFEDGMVELPTETELQGLHKKYDTWLTRVSEEFKVEFIPQGYLYATSAPEDVVLRVMWERGSFGEAKMILGYWFQYGFENPHANGMPCSVPLCYWQEK